MNMGKSYDVIIIGGGHAGCEAALAAARMGVRALLLTPSLDFIAAMSCNPAIGGLAKGNLVKDIDALGGEMAKNIDASSIQFQTLNCRKGAAARSSRAQADRRKYSERMTEILFTQKNLTLKQSAVSRILTKNGEVLGAETLWGEVYSARKVILAVGTFLKGKIFIGETSFPAGRAYEPSSLELADSLKSLGFEAVRLKTGTPARLHADSIDFSKLEIYETEGEKIPFSFENQSFPLPQIKCYVTYTNSRTHAIVKENLHKSLYYNSMDKGVGPRYCPSMEDKITKFPERERHQIILETEGINSKEVYPNGFSTSLPADAQIAAYRTVRGLEKCRFIRPAYAIEYEAFQPTGIYPTYETKKVKGLYFAGQINGTSGYEEAACQGLMAGINAVLSLDGKDPFILGRDESYIGVLTDDLTTKGIDEPYRMFTSRGEYRLHLREDNAEYRLIEYGRKLGLISENRYLRFKTEKNDVEKEIERFKNLRVKLGEETEKILRTSGCDTVRGTSAYELLKRPECSIEHLKCLGFTELEGRAARQVEIRVKYSGYIAKQAENVERFKKLERKKIPADFDYAKVSGLRREYVEKLTVIRPGTLGQAVRIPGMTLAAAAILDIALEKERA